MLGLIPTGRSAEDVVRELVADGFHQKHSFRCRRSVGAEGEARASSSIHIPIDEHVGILLMRLCNGLGSGDRAPVWVAGDQLALHVF
jgi:hypothetical protein